MPEALGRGHVDPPGFRPRSRAGDRPLLRQQQTKEILQAQLRRGGCGTALTGESRCCRPARGSLNRPHRDAVNVQLLRDRVWARRSRKTRRDSSRVSRAGDSPSNWMGIYGLVSVKTALLRDLIRSHSVLLFRFQSQGTEHRDVCHTAKEQTRAIEDQALTCIGVSTASREMVDISPKLPVGAPGRVVKWRGECDALRSGHGSWDRYRTRDRTSPCAGWLCARPHRAAAQAAGGSCGGA